MKLGKTRFETALQVRPDDLDFFRHVHSSRYLDYVLAARFEQMERCYGLSMQAFLARELGWVVKVSHFEYRRPLGMAEHFVVGTWVEEIRGSDAEVRFEIKRREDGKVAALGWCVFTLVGLKTGRPEPMPEDVREAYSI